MTGTCDIGYGVSGAEDHAPRLASQLLDVIDDASDQDRRTWVTDHGKRVAMVCTVEDGELLERMERERDGRRSSATSTRW